MGKFRKRSESEQARTRERAAEYGLKKSASVRDIGPPEPCRNLERRARGLDDLEFFLRTYFEAAFPLPFSNDHRDVIATLERVERDGGLYALAMPRGGGKTTIVARAALRAILAKRRRFVVIVTATDQRGKTIVRDLKSELRNSVLLQDDFPELWGFRQLGGDNRRAGGQLCCGEKTDIKVGQTEIIFPTLPGSECSGSIIASCGLTGNIRGQSFTRKDGTVIRPDMAILDDPQTKESSRSAAQTQERSEIIEGDVLGLAGPGSGPIACIMPCTVIETDDLSERYLKNPLWNGKRTKTLIKFPKNLQWWDQYFEFQAECRRVDKSTEKADVLYLREQAIADEDAQHAWPDDKRGRISAIQYAMELWYQSPTAFAAEYQNEPLNQSVSADTPTCRGLAEKLTKLERGVVPLWATKLTAGIDVQGKLLYWLVVAWADDFTGSVIDYGAFPDQPRAYFTLAEASPTLQDKSGSSQLEGALTWGLDRLTERLCGREWEAESGNAAFKIGSCLIDQQWEQSKATVNEVCRRSKFSGVLMPASGKGITSTSAPMASWKFDKALGEQMGDHWLRRAGKHKVRILWRDTNYWKTFIAERCGAVFGERGGLSVFGTKPEQHRLLMDHLLAEAATRKPGSDRTVDEWHCKPGVDNHWLDCLTMAAAAASVLGSMLGNFQAVAPKPKKKWAAADIQRRRLGA